MSDIEEAKKDKSNDGELKEDCQWLCLKMKRRPAHHEGGHGIVALNES